MIMIAVGAWAKIGFDEYALLSPNVHYSVSSDFLIAAGVILILIEFIGLYGTWNENKMFMVIVSITGCNRGC